MEWLTPLSGIYAAAFAIPTLLLLYFLKLKRREKVIGCTLLWKRAVQDLQVNAPFQKLRRNILLLFQLLAILGILAAIAGPVLSLDTAPVGRYVILVDHSGSMNATDIPSSRLEEAKKQARDFVESLRGESFFGVKDNADQAMVIAFNSSSKVMCNFVSDKKQLLRAIDDIKPTDGKSLLKETLQVAQAFAQSPGVETNNRSSLEPAKIVLFSDGKIIGVDDLAVGSDVIYHQIGKEADNLGVTAMQAKRSYEHPEEVSVFATIANYSETEQGCDIQLSIDNNVKKVKFASIPPSGSTELDSKKKDPGKVSVSFSLEHPGAGVVEVRCIPTNDSDNDFVDYLAADDAAWSILPPPKKLSVMLVTEGNPALESAFGACPLAKLEITNSNVFIQNSDNKTFEDTAADYDVIILDNTLPEKLPRGRYLIFGEPPEGIGVEVTGEIQNQTIVDWRWQHSLLKYVDMNNLYAAKCVEMTLPRDAEVLAEFNETPAISILRRNGSAFILAGFDVMDTNWPFETSFILFCYNSMAYLGTEMDTLDKANMLVSQIIMVDDLISQKEYKIAGPDFDSEKLLASKTGAIRFSGTERAGIYSIDIPEKETKIFAVNMLSESESNIAPANNIEFSDKEVAAQESAAGNSNIPIWPYLAFVALILIFVEWLIYNSKMRL
ncbi:MAG: VWA domain-containing protein [Phycisphaerae bacterium]|nr:VWA domain-containing protein [Phycisphaerae bacterium]